MIVKTFIYINYNIYRFNQSLRLVDEQANE